MTVYKAFNEIEALDSISNVQASTVTAVSGVARAGFCHKDLASEVEASTSVTLDSAISDCWVHVLVQDNEQSNTKAGNILEVRDSNDDLLVRVYATHNESGAMSVSSVLDGTLEAINAAYETKTTFDFHIKVDPSVGFVRVYQDGSLVYSKDGDTENATGATGVEKITFRQTGTFFGSVGDSQKTHFGQVIIADTNTIGAEVYTLDPSAGTTNDWPIGDVTDVDETGADDSDQMITDTALDEVNFDSSVTLSALTEPKSFTALVQSYRASLDASASVTGLTPFLETDGDTNTYYASSPAALTTGLAGYQEVWSTDPSDSSNWTAAKINGYQYGYRADN